MTLKSSHNCAVKYKPNKQYPLTPPCCFMKTTPATATATAMSGNIPFLERGTAASIVPPGPGEEAPAQGRLFIRAPWWRLAIPCWVFSFS